MAEDGSGEPRHSGLALWHDAPRHQRRASRLWPSRAQNLRTRSQRIKLRLGSRPATRRARIPIRELHRSSNYEEIRVVLVEEQDGETVESALRRFNRTVLKDVVLRAIKRHSFYLKPGEKRRTKEALARKRSRKKRSRDAE